MTASLAPSRRLLPARRLGTPPPNATLVARSDLSPTMATFAVLPDGGVPAFSPGQYFALGLAIDRHLVQRPYSASSAAADPTLEFAVRLVPHGALTPRLWQLRPGDRLRVGPPRGLFGLLDGDTRTHLLLGTGTGVAPLVAMARSLAARPRPPRTVVVHGAARADELAFGPRLAGWAATTPGWRYEPAVSRPAEPPNAGWHGRVGRVDAAVGSLVGELAVDPTDCVAYVCGNPEMTVSVTEGLIGLGLPSEAIRAEPY